MHAFRVAGASLRLLALTAAVVGLAACGGRDQHTVKADLPPDVDKVVQIRFPPALDGQGSYRFNMQQGDKRMTADEFEAWMQANGFRVAKGAKGAVAPEKK